MVKKKLQTQIELYNEFESFSSLPHLSQRVSIDGLQEGEGYRSNRDIASELKIDSKLPNLNKEL